MRVCAVEKINDGENVEFLCLPSEVTSVLEWLVSREEENSNAQFLVSLLEMTQEEFDSIERGEI